MTTKVKAEQKPTEPAAMAAEQKPAEPARTRECVVKADFHVGLAVNGRVCSYHAMHYLADGTRRKPR